MTDSLLPVTFFILSNVLGISPTKLLKLSEEFTLLPILEIWEATDGTIETRRDNAADGTNEQRRE